jgi:hypothetical protein
MSTVTKPSPARTVRRWLLRIALGVGAIVGLWAAKVAYDGRQLQQQWQEACAEADRLDPGWRWDEWAATWPNLPDERNSFVRARAVAQTVSRWDPLDKEKRLFDEYMRSRSQPHRPSPQVLAVLRKRVAAAGPTLADALALADYPEGCVPLATSPVIHSTVASPFDILDLVRYLLYPQFLVQVEDGDFDAAFVTLRAIVYTSRPLVDSPRLIDNLLGMSLRHFAATGVEHVLAQGEPPAATLDAARRLLKQEARRPVLLSAFRGERAAVEDTIRAYSDGRLSRDDVAKWGIFSDAGPWDGNFSGAYLANRVTGRDFRWPNAIAQLRHYTWMVERLKESPDGLMERADEWAALRDQLPGTSKVYMKNLSGYVPQTSTTEARFRCVVPALAAEQFRRANGRWPTTLDELVPMYLAAVPRDPFTSQPLRLARRPDGIVIYSISEDKKDDGGDLPEGQQKGRDTGIRLWDMDQRRQPPVLPKTQDGGKK